MDFREILKTYLLNEEGALKTIGKEAAVVLKDLELLGKEGRYLRDIIKLLDNLEPAQFAKLEKRGIQVTDLISRAEKATAENADTIAKEIDDAIKGKSAISAGETTPLKKSSQLSPEQLTNKEFDALLARADKLEAAGQYTAAINVRRRAFQLIGEEFEEATKLPSVKAEKWSKLNAQRVELLKNPNTPKQITDDVLRQMDSIYPRTTWQRIAQWARENPKKAWLFGFLGTGALGAVGYEVYQSFKKDISPKPTSSSTPGSTPGSAPSGKKCKGTLKIGCKGDNVKEMQQKLINHGYPLPKKGADGWFGSETKAAVKSFQADRGLKSDGVAGNETLKALESSNTSKVGTKEEPPTEKLPAVSDTKETAGQEINPASKEIKSKEDEVQTFPGLKDNTRVSLKSTPYWMTNTWKNTPEKDRTLELKQRLINQGWADEKTWEERAKAGIPMEESKIQKDYFLNSIKSRHESVEKLVFERLIKNAR